MGYAGWALAGALAVIVVILLMMRISTTMRGNRGAPVGSAARTWAITRAFTDYWRDAPINVQAWIAGLTDTQYADVYQWMCLVVGGKDRDGVDARATMFQHFVAVGIAQADDAPLFMAMTIEDCRRLTLVMEAA